MKKQKTRCGRNKSAYQLALGYFREESKAAEAGDNERANFFADLADFWYEIDWVLR